MEKPTKVLITGGTAKSGGCAINELIKTDHPVRAMVHSIDERSEELEAKGVKVVTAGYFIL
ncbi:NmrA family NAD(P)-binding protein [Dyadobacter subterraneus]|uniref:NmrA family NAD(P)-binding protein n=1 Tax=Dyadobacter subterraneus TaxID=2773304 RepID=A0ABR9WHQ9_9BACT|nr:NmrA family NAD(P)-binding protein [Dyadobacter subterraneus]MBE9463699.1 NmrA family NAD(P)-binding protein [Dyadobacter subterraneus]